jgi:RNA polymerase sigma-70 factor (ECF subfamily)
MSEPRIEPSDALPPVEPSSGGPVGGVPSGLDATSDETLLQGARQRDETALLGLYDRYGGLVYTLARRIVGERDLAEEVTQDVFLRCWQGLEEHDAARGTLPVWLLGIARSRAFEVLRGRQGQTGRRDGEPLPESGERAAHRPEAPVHADDTALGREVGEALAELSEPQRAAVELAYYGGLTQTEVADRLGEPLGAVKTRIRDGVRRLRRLLASIVDDGTVRGGGSGSAGRDAGVDGEGAS